MGIIRKRIVELCQRADGFCEDDIQEIREASSAADVAGKLFDVLGATDFRPQDRDAAWTAYQLAVSIANNQRINEIDSVI